MAVCEDCEREMTTADSCVVEHLLIRGRVFRRRPHVRECSCCESRCGDCNVTTGAWHHLGCDMERCPSCGGQLLSCSCGDTEDEEHSCVHPLIPRDRQS